MRASLTLLIFACLVPLGKSQRCVYTAGSNASQGATSFAPFGNTATNDPKWSSQRMLMLIPRAVLGTTKRRIRAIGFAPAASRTRVIGQLTISFRQTDQTTLKKTFHLNGSGFASAVQFQNILWPTRANAWNRFPAQYPFDPSRNLLIEVNVRGAGSTGSGDAGFRQDPNLQVVTANSATARDGVVGKGGLKLEICFEGGDLLQVFDDAACKGTNGKNPRLDMTGSARLGNTMNINLKDAPGKAGIAILVWSFLGYFSKPFDLGGSGAPGCFLRSQLTSVLPAPTSNGVVTVPFPIPADKSLLSIKGPFAFQWFVFDPGANAMNLTSSNWGIANLGS